MKNSELTTPLDGIPYYRNVGLIKVFDNYNRTYNIGEIIFERYDEQNFQYIIKPYWKCIDYIPKGIFHGIPGINMELRKNNYYRVNMTPAFISMRTPSEGREDVIELMESVNLDYYDRFEWLLRSEMKCGDDNLFVVRKRINNHKLKKFKNIHIHPDDIIEIDSLSDISTSNSKLVEDMYKLFQSGSKIYVKNEDRIIGEEEHTIMLHLLKYMIECWDKNNKNKRTIGIEKAKEDKKYKGRKPIEIDEQLLKQTAISFLNNQISEKDAMNKLNINSRSTFYRKIKQFRTY